MSYTFTDGKYRTYVRSSFDNSNNNTGVYAYSEYYAFEKVGSFMYSFAYKDDDNYEYAIDTRSLSVYKIDSGEMVKMVTYLEGDCHGLHYKHYYIPDEDNPNKAKANAVTVITGTQTSDFNMGTDWGFINKANGFECPIVYFDGTAINFGRMFWFMFDTWVKRGMCEMVFGRRAVLPIFNNLFCPSSMETSGTAALSCLWYIDNISNSPIIVSRADAITYNQGYLRGVEKNIKFIGSIQFNDSVNTLHRMFSNDELIPSIGPNNTLAINKDVSLYYTFSGCYSLTGTLDLRNILSINDIAYSFPFCRRLKKILFKTSNAGVLTRMWSAFEYCTQLEEIDLSGFTTSSSGITMAGAFENCPSLKSIKMKNIIINTVNNNTTFYRCSALEYFETPSLASSSLVANLPHTMYDAQGNAYTTLPPTSTVLYKANTAVQTWSTKTWDGFAPHYASYVWEYKNNVYYSYGSSMSSAFSQYILDKNTGTWVTKTWNGFSYIYGNGMWNDGEHVYYSWGNDQYVLVEETDTWVSKTWNGLSNISGNYVWTDGENYYYSLDNKQYMLDKQTSTWIPKIWNGAQPDGRYIWNDGTDTYFSYGSQQYVLDKQISDWIPKTWSGLTYFNGDLVWKDNDNNIYYSTSEKQYILNKGTYIWAPKNWSGLTPYGGNIWIDGTNVYSSANNSQYILDK